MPGCTLETDRLRLIVDPNLGGAIRRLDVRAPSGEFFPLLRPTPDQATRRGETSCFLMLPWVGRIPSGRFAFRETMHTLRVDSSDGKHAIHGDITQRSFTITDRSPVSVRMELDACGDRLRDRNWPWDYRADLRYELGPDRVMCELGITNPSTHAFPVGGGFHPYFQRRLWAEHADESCTLNAGVRGHYPMTNLAATGPAVPDALTQSLVRGTHFPDPTDDVFLRDMHAPPPRIAWPRSGVRMTLELGDNLTHLVCWAPHENGTRTGFFCVEPLSTTTDAFNLHAKGQAETGVLELEPGARVSFRMNFRFEGLPR